MAYEPSPIRRESVITRAAEEVCRFIEAQGLAPGDLLPTETRLATMFGISRNSIREALRILHGLGHVEKSAGRRIVVTAASQSGKGVFDESVLLEAAPVANNVRSLIAEHCAQLAAVRLTTAELDELGRLLRELQEAIARDDSDAARTVHDAFHGRLMAGARNPLLTALFNQAQIARLSNVSPDHRSFTDPRHVGHHRALLRALRRRDAAAAGKVVRRHFQSLGLMLEVVAATGADGSPRGSRRLSRSPLRPSAGKCSGSPN